MENQPFEIYTKVCPLEREQNLIVNDPRINNANAGTIYARLNGPRETLDLPIPCLENPAPRISKRNDYRNFSEFLLNASEESLEFDAAWIRRKFFIDDLLTPEAFKLINAVYKEFFLASKYKPRQEFC